MRKRKCRVDNCPNNNRTGVSFRRDLCEAHYRRLLHKGTVDAGRPLFIASPRHGMHRSPTYKSWRNMRARCLYPKYHDYRHYGGRGITICPEWNDFNVFLADMGERPTGKTLDRVDTNGNYSAENCRWSDMSVQNYNRRRRRPQGMRGVYASESGRFYAKIGVDSQVFYIGMFDTEPEAANAYDQWATCIYGDSADLNFVYK